jgi:hypothetical protein
LTPAGYKLEHVPRNSGRGGGVAVLYKASITCKKERVAKYSSFEVIELLLSIKCSTIRLCVIYRPPGGTHSKPIGTFLTEFQNYMSNQSTSSGKLIVIGDFNIHVDVNKNVDAKKFADLLFSLNLEQHVHVPTHEHGHILDLVLTRSHDLAPLDLKIHPAVMSDHLPITFKISVCRPSAVKKVVKFRKLKAIDVPAFQQDLQACPLITSPAKDVIALVDQYNTELSTLLDIHAPLIKKEVFIRPNTPWFTENMSDAKRRTRQAERRWRSSRLTVHLELLRMEKSHYNDLCKKEKAQYYQSRISENATDQKALFRITDELLHKKKDARLPLHESNKELANRFSIFFDDKLRTISQSFGTSDPPFDAHVYDASGRRPMSSFQAAAGEEKSVCLGFQNVVI